jgi:hypothetical protein
VGQPQKGDDQQTPGAARANFKTSGYEWPQELRLALAPFPTSGKTVLNESTRRAGVHVLNAHLGHAGRAQNKISVGLGDLGQMSKPPEHCNFM